MAIKAVINCRAMESLGEAFALVRKAGIDPQRYRYQID